MRYSIIAALAIFSLCPALPAQNAPPGDVREFQLTPIAPPTPALKYQLLFGPLDRRPGNAALPYMELRLMIDDSYSKLIIAADDAYDTQKMSEFDDAAKKMDNQRILGLLDLGGRDDQCDWQVPLREQGMLAHAPYLNSVRVAAQIVRIAAVENMRQGKIDDALGQLRLGYELGHKVCLHPTLVGSLVGVGIVQMMDQVLADMMNQPGSPNLYWALASLPKPMVSVSCGLEGEFTSRAGSFPELAQANLDDLSPVQWRQLFQKMTDFWHPSGQAPAPAWSNSQTLTGEVERNLPKAREYYARTRTLPVDQVQNIPPFKMVSIFWCEEYRNMADELLAMAELPCPILIAKAEDWNSRVKQLQKDQPANPFLTLLPSASGLVQQHVRLARTLAALTDVEAIRSYAAAHDGKLPPQLQDITDTPALENPRTGRPFDYLVTDDIAVLSDTDPPDYPLSYGIQIRK